MKKIVWLLIISAIIAGQITWLTYYYETKTATTNEYGWPFPYYILNGQCNDINPEPGVTHFCFDQNLAYDQNHEDWDYGHLVADWLIYFLVVFEILFLTMGPRAQTAKRRKL